MSVISENVNLSCCGGSAVVSFMTVFVNRTISRNHMISCHLQKIELKKNNNTRSRNDLCAYAKFGWGGSYCPQVLEANGSQLVHVCTHAHRCAVSQTNKHTEIFQMVRQIVSC